MSDYRAVEALHEALERTKELLWPIDYALWLKLALVAMLTAGLGGSNVRYTETFQGLPDPGIDAVILIALILAFFFFIGLILSYLSTLSQFVLVGSLITKKIKLKDYYSEYACRGLNFFLFEVAAIIVFALMLAGLGALAFYTIQEALAANLFLLVLLIFSIIVAAVLLGLFFGFLTEFSLPIYYLGRHSLFESIRESFNILIKNPAEFLIYYLLKILLSLLVGALIFSVTFFIFSVPMFAILFGVGVAVTAISILASQAPAALVLLALALAGLFTILVTTAFSYLISVLTLPLTVFFRYYSLIFLDRLDSSLGLFTMEPPSDSNTSKPKTIRVC
jgi:hypothetical protein